MKILKKILGSALVEKIMIVVFSLVAGAAVITFLVNQVNEAKKPVLDVDEQLNGGYSNEDILPNIVIPEREGYFFTYIATEEDEQNGYTEHKSTFDAFNAVKDVRFIAEVVVYLDEVKSVEFYNYFVDFVESLDDVKFFIVIKENDSFGSYYTSDRIEFRFSECNDYLFSYARRLSDGREDILIKNPSTIRIDGYPTQAIFEDFIKDVPLHEENVC